ncbi:response regulator transcription factor [Alteromonas sp. ALT199]|uniref:response regulator transcription factor n=1 Tax=unclassified Alteromonas TaxID=2614992 RepID=UPI0004455E6D|nr:response regulator transcription factor [Alteromonas sp. ALT199]MBT3134077.1 response regulator transcription factor [Alteromonas sp. ALT199]
MENEKINILLVDDDKDLCALLQEFLEGDGFNVDAIHSGDEAIKTLLNTDKYDTVVLDIMMPGMSGLDVLKSVRAEKQTPILMLTGRGDDIDRIVGLELGADDYLPKPCNPRELGARIRAIIRRTQYLKTTPATSQSELHGIYLDSGARQATVNGKSIALTGAEFNALSYLMERVGQTISKQEITQEVLKRPLEAYDRAMDVHVSRIRQKLAAVGVTNVIQSVRGVGYQMLTVPQQSE